MMISTDRSFFYIFSLFMVVATMVLPPSPAHARTTLQLEEGSTLSFADGSIDMMTGSGELFDVIVIEYGEEIARAEYLRIDATGGFGEADWFVNELVADNLEAV